jgi:glutaredoxin 3
MSVTIYSTSSCPWCKRAKEYLDEKKVEYTEIDVSVDPAGAEKMLQKTQQMGVPVLDIHGKIVVGFDPIAIDEALL